MSNIAFQAHLIILVALGCMCLVMVLLTGLIDYQSSGRKRALIYIELTTGVLLLACFLENIGAGDTTVYGHLMCVVYNFLDFALIFVEIIAFNKYVHSFTKRKEDKGTKAEGVIQIVSYVGIALIVISQFNGMFYSINAENEYIRGPLFIISYIAPLVAIGVMLYDVIKNRKFYSKKIYISAMFFSLAPLICSVAQIVFDKLSLFAISMGVSTVIIFSLSLADQNEQLRIVARSDRMTRLPNAYGLLLALDKKIATNEVTNYSAFYFDIIRMGMINRKYGNEVGDYIIRSYAKRVSDYLEEDEVLGRLGGNYFVAIVRKERAEDFLQFLGGVEIEITTAHGNDKVVVSAVAGIYEIDDAHITSNQIMTYISLAVNIAKNIKKKPYVYLTKELLQEMNEQRQLQEIIPKCMAQKEFKPFYQPKVNLKSNKMCGAEALARWIHNGEIVPPYRFIPSMERNESICRLDFYMLHEVCRDIKGWIEEGLNPPTISVNFSRKNLGNPILAEEIYNVVKSYDIPLDLIQIEITETVDEYPLDYLKGVVEALQRYGLTAAIDDFGTGSSSIKILKEVPFDVLKIDKSFIDSITDRDKHILAHIIGIANEMQARIITEGVETKEQITVLKELGCEEIQGYFFDKPIDKKSFEERIKNPIYKNV